MWLMLKRNHEEQLEKEYKIFSFENGNKNGDVVIKCNDGELKTHSEMLLQCSEYFKDYHESKINGSKNEITLPFNKKTVTMALTTFYGEDICYFEEWNDLVDYFLLVEYLLPSNDANIYINKECNSIIDNIKYGKGGYKLIDSFRKSSDRMYETVKDVINVDNKYITKINNALIDQLSICAKYKYKPITNYKKIEKANT